MDTDFRQLEAFWKFAYGTQERIQSMLRQLGWVPSNGMWTNYKRGVTCTWKHAIEIEVAEQRGTPTDSRHAC